MAHSKKILKLRYYWRFWLDGGLILSILLGFEQNLKKRGYGFFWAENLKA